MYVRTGLPPSELGTGADDHTANSRRHIDGRLDILVLLPPLGWLLSPPMSSKVEAATRAPLASSAQAREESTKPGPFVPSMGWSPSPCRHGCASTPSTVGSSNIK
jgi:hypothetical protein